MPGRSISQYELSESVCEDGSTFTLMLSPCAAKESDFKLLLLLVLWLECEEDVEPESESRPALSCTVHTDSMNTTYAHTHTQSVNLRKSDAYKPLNILLMAQNYMD
jgi:hypothetical protein